jgi:uncharacterized protein (DUF2267 family)
MKYDEFVGEVQRRAHLVTLDDAVKATGATLETLAERLPYEEARILAGELPHGLRHYVAQAATDQDFGLDEFFNRVAAREDADVDAATLHARVVMAVLRNAISPGTLAKVLNRLPGDHNALIGGIGKAHAPGGRR